MIAAIYPWVLAGLWLCECLFHEVSPELLCCGILPKTCSRSRGRWGIWSCLVKSQNQQSVFAPLVRCALWSTPSFSHSNQPEEPLKEVCKSEQARNSADPRTCAKTGRSYDIFPRYFRTFCAYAIILVLSGLYMWIHQHVQHLQWFNKELTACALRGSCHSRHSREQGNLHSIFITSNHEWAGKKQCNHSVTRLTMI